MRKAAALLSCLLVSLVLLSGQEALAVDDRPEGRGPEPPYGALLLAGFFVPGIGEIALGNGTEGYACLASALPLTAIGAGLLFYDLMDPASGMLVPSDDPSALPDGRAPETLVRQYVGSALLAAGLGINFYSAYAFHRDWQSAYGNPANAKRDSFTDIVAAPFLPRNFFSYETALPLLIVGAAALGSGRESSIADYFASERQPFMGYWMSPAGALAARIGTAGFLALAEAVATETMFRGLVLERDGPVAAISLDAARHLPDLVMPGSSAGETWSDTLAGAVWGLYATVNIGRDGGRLGKAISARFWYSLTSAVLDYVENPWNARLASVSVTFRW